MKNILTTVCTLAVLFCYSQSVTVRYSETMDLSNELAEMEMPEDLGGLSGEFIKNMISSAMNKPSTFELKANKIGETIYSAIEDETEENGSMISMYVSSNEDIIYTNYQQKTYTQQSNFMSRKFLIDGEIKQLDWTLLNEDSRIAGYDCKKAFSLDTPTDTVYAWYSDAIPFQYGPKKFGGLPGLILKVSIEGTEIIATSVSLSKDDLEINKPQKGKKVSAQEFEEIQKKRMNDMGGREDGSKIEIITM
ncbi:MAG: GLPGLI family protein [Flavobacteriales bacterium]|nr:GLPGLI family protein [Flavobacteriales bacterium]